MSTVLENKPVAQDNLAEKLNFSKNLQAVTNKIHATSNIDEIMLELSQDICALFNADRLTLYLVSEDKTSIVSKVKTGLNSFKDLKLPIAEQSIAGFVAVHKKMINIRDVYDEKELKSYSPHLNFLKQVDTKTGYRTKQMLVAPVLDAQTKDLIGVVQIINSKAGQPFLPMIEEGATHVCETLAIAYKQRQKPALAVRGKYDHLVTNAVISAEELDLATRSSRRKNLDIETVLIDEFQVKVQAIGEALAAYFGVPYEPFKADRVKPMDLMKNMSREFVESSMWLPVDDTKDGIIVLTVDPEKIRGSIFDSFLSGRPDGTGLGLAIALMIRAAVGASPWDVFHLGATRHVPMSFGMVMVVTALAVLLACGRWLSTVVACSGFPKWMPLHRSRLPHELLRNLDPLGAHSRCRGAPQGG